MIEVFNFESQQVRFVGTADNPWWVAKDICEVLEILKAENAYKRLEDYEKDTRSVGTPGGQQEMICVNESGLYSLILVSRKPQAKKFKKWVTSVVLPAIRKTGSYSVEQKGLSIEESILLADCAARAAINAGVNRDVSEQLKIEGLIKMFPDSGHLLKPQKEAIAASNPLPDAPMTPTEVGQQLAFELDAEKVSARAVNSKLLELGYQVSVTRTKRSNGKEVHHYYMATEKGKNHSQLQLSAYIDGEGKNTKPQLRWFSSIVPILVNNWESE